jgi:hypothetical protein
LVTVGTCWECIGNSLGMGWELFGNTLRTLWGTIWELSGNRRDAFECFPHFTFLHYKFLLIHYIIHCTHIVYYILYRYNVVYIVCIAYCTSYKPAVYNSPRMGSVVTEPMSQHFAFILCIRLSLDNPYGTIIS